MAQTTTRKSSAKKWTLLALIMFLLVAVIGGTYTRYSSTANKDVPLSVAKWAVKVNSNDITASNTLTASFVPVSNDNVVAGQVAPSSELYADFIIDPTGSEVAVDYEFELGDIKNGNAIATEDFIVEKVVTVNGSTETPIDETSGKYKGTIDLPGTTGNKTVMTASQAQTVRVYVKWTNVEAHNEQDTTLGINEPDLNMNIKATVMQHI